MEFLRSIIPVIDKTKFLSELGGSQQLISLYEIIDKGRVLDEIDIERKIYNGSENTAGFKKLKQRLREKITDHAVKHGVSYKNLDSYAIVYRKCMQQVFAVKTLGMSNARKAAATLGENVLKTTKKYELTDLSLLLASELFYYYSAINHHGGKAKRYKALLNEMMTLQRQEAISLQYYCDLLQGFGSARGALKEKFLVKAIKYCKELKEFLSGPVPSYQLTLQCYLVFALRFELVKDYKGLLAICNEAIKVFETRKVSRVFALYLFDIRRIICYIQFKEHQKAEQIALKYFSQMVSGHYNWFILKSFVLVSKLHSRQYYEAYVILEEVVSNKQYEKLPNPARQMWIIYEAHVRFLIAIEKITPKEQSISKFRLYKFLNEIPIFSKDKRGLNVAILILQVLFLLHQRKYSEIIDRVDALNQYCHRYLRKDETFRSNCFVKMLLKTAQADFNKKRAERYAQPFLAKLQDSPLQSSDQNIEVEIIPYDHLWSMVLEILE